MNIKDDFILSKINEGYLVGGSIRDFLLCGKIPEDRDITIKNAKAFAEKMAAEFNGTLITLDEENKIYRVALHDKMNYLDIAELAGNTIEEDLIRRDFTINAIAYDLKSEKFIDITGGINDLKNGIIKHIKDENFEDDPLRILRAFRFMAVTGFHQDESTKNAIKKYCHLLDKPAKERITYEIMKLFGGPGGKYGGKSVEGQTSRTLIEMDKFGILEIIFPQVKEMKQVPPNAHHHLDLFHHVIETVRQVELFYENSPDKIKEHLDRIDFGGFPRINHLKLAAFLHDIGKFSTWTIEEDTGRHRFIRHEDAGAKNCIPFLKEMKFSKKQIDYISCMIKKHLYPSSVLNAPELNEKVMMRFIRKMEDNSIDIILLAEADRLSARGPEITDEIVKENIQGLDKLLNFYLKKRETLTPLPKLIDGFEVMKIKGIKASPALGKILNALHEAQINGDILTKDDAISFVKNYK